MWGGSGTYLGTDVADVGHGVTEPWINIGCGGHGCPPHAPTCFQLFLLQAQGLTGPDGEPGQGKDRKRSPLYKKVVSLKNEALALTTDVKKNLKRRGALLERTEQLLDKSSNQLVRKLPLRKWKKVIWDMSAEYRCSLRQKPCKKADNHHCWLLIRRVPANGTRWLKSSEEKTER